MDEQTEAMLKKLDDSHARAIEPGDTGPTLYSQAAAEIRRLVRKSELRRALLDQITAQAHWLSNAHYEVEHGDEADAARTICERSAEGTLLFREGRRVLAMTADLMDSAAKGDLWGNVPGITDHARRCREMSVPPTDPAPPPAPGPA